MQASLRKQCHTASRSSQSPVCKSFCRSSRKQTARSGTLPCLSFRGCDSFNVKSVTHFSPGHTLNDCELLHRQRQSSCRIKGRRRGTCHAMQESRQHGGDNVPSTSAPGSLEAQLGSICQKLTSYFPLWVVLAAVTGFYSPQLYTWFGTPAITAGLMLVMLGMGITLRLEDIAGVFTRMPQLLLLGMVLQYTTLPAVGYLISRYWGLSSGLAAGVALVSCMPGGTASNIVAYLANGEMPLSIMMTTASTLMAVVTTPLLTSLLLGTMVKVDPMAMFLSTLQLVLAPVLLGAAANTTLPNIMPRVAKFAPFFATVLCVLIVGSMMGSNIAVVRQSGPQIIAAVMTLHGTGFALGYFISRSLKLSERICRTNAIEVGMQSSALAAVLAKLHFSDPIIVAPCVLSACTHATMGSLLAGYWRNCDKQTAAVKLA